MGQHHKEFPRGNERETKEMFSRSKNTSTTLIHKNEKGLGETHFTTFFFGFTRLSQFVLKVSESSERGIAVLSKFDASVRIFLQFCNQGRWPWI